MTEFVEITHPHITATGRVARTALKCLGPGWRIAGESPEATEAAVEDFDPAKHTVAEVLAHLEVSGAREQARVLALEAESKARSGVLTFAPEADPAD